MALIGAATITRPLVQGNKDSVFIGGIKSLLTHSMIAKPDIKRPEQLKGKRIGVSRIGSNPHYFAVQALRQFGIDSREVSYIQAGGAPETLAALVAQGIDAAVLTVPTDAQALQAGLPLRRLRPRSKDRLRRDDVHHAPFDHRQTRDR